MKIFLIISLFISYLANAQSKGLTMKGDTLVFIKGEGDTLRINKNVPAMTGQAGKVVSTDGSSYTWYDIASALSAKQNSLGFTAVPNTLTVNGKALNANISVTASDVGLGNVTNESKATMFTNPAFTGTPTGLTSTHVGLSNVDNTSDANKPVSTATQTALNNKSTFYVGLDAGANDSYSITASPVPGSYTQGMIVMFRANTQNTTGCSINVNGLGAKTIVKRVSTTPATGDILALMWCMLVYDGSNFVLMNPVVN